LTVGTFLAPLEALLLATLLLLVAVLLVLAVLLLGELPVAVLAAVPGVVPGGVSRRIRERGTLMVELQ
jgi:hypothetical protein